jgi:hypothetical protein
MTVAPHPDPFWQKTHIALVQDLVGNLSGKATLTPDWAVVTRQMTAGNPQWATVLRDDLFLL